MKCFADGELPQERKVYPAVQISHPAVTLGHIIQRAEQSVRFFLPEATTEDSGGKKYVTTQKNSKLFA